MPLETASDQPTAVALLMDDIKRINDPRIDKITAFYESLREALLIAKGSSYKHQAWEGGYVDHIRQCLQLAEMHYKIHQGPDDVMPFSLDSAKIALLFHDIEKPFKYGMPETWTGEFDKIEFLYGYLASRWNIHFTPEEINALTYTHGEGHDYDPKTRVMGPLAAFVHSIDTMSARIFYDRGPFRPVLTDGRQGPSSTDNV